MATPIVSPIQQKTLVHEPGRTLGRSGYVVSDQERMLNLAEYLDALLCVVADSNGAPNEPTAFQCLNHSIQLATLRLASHLAEELHDTIEKGSVDVHNRSTQAQEAHRG